MCANENQVFVNYTSLYSDWLDTVSRCFETGTRPTDYSNSHLVQVDKGSELWTGIIRSKVIFNKDEHIPQTGEIEFGYLKRIDGNIYQLKFRNDDSDKRYLCSSEQTTVISDGTTFYTKETTLMSSSEEISDKRTSTSTPKKTSYFTPILSSTDITTEIVSTYSNSPTKAQHVMEQQKGSTTGVYVGISVAVVFVIAAVIIAIVLLKRREAAPSKSIKHTSDIAAISNNNYEEVEDSPYDKSIGTATQMGIDNSVNSFEDSGHYAHTYFVLEDNANRSTTENSIAFSSKHFKGTDESNVYNTLNSHIKHKNNVDNTYDTSETAIRKLKTQLSKEFDGQMENVFNGRDEDTYNHIIGKPHNKNDTDNVYGVAHANENDYGDIQERSEKETDEEDTYNRINITQFQTNENV